MDGWGSITMNSRVSIGSMGVGRSSIGSVSTCNYGASGLGHLFCNITGGLVDLITREFTPFRQRSLVAPESERLRDICTSSCKLHSKLLNSLRMFSSCLWSPGACSGIASLLQSHDVASIS